MLTPSLSRSAAKTHVDYISGPVRIKDAIYMGDEIAAKDIDFIASNKVTHIINTVVKRIPNLFEKYGIQYLSVNWSEKQTNIFDKKNNAMTMIFNFIEEAMQQGESVLVHSLHGKSRAGCVIIAYLMKKFCWSLQKSLDYVVSKKESFKIRSHFLSQLQQLQKRLTQANKLSSSWNTYCHEEDLILANTYKNTRTQTVFTKQEPKNGKKKVCWGEKLVSSSDNRPVSHNILTSTSKYKQYLQQFEVKQNRLKSILKNDGDRDHIKKKEQIDDKKEEESIQKLEVSSLVKQNTKQLENSNKRYNPGEEQRLSKSQAIGNNKVNNHSGYVVVNNFMSNQKPKNERYSSIPVRQQKQKEKKLQSKSGSRLAPYENIISSIKSPYDINFINRIGQNSKPRRREEHHEQKGVGTQERPHSVNNADDNTRGNSNKQTASRISNRQDLMYGSYNKNWPSQRQNIIRYK